MTHTPQVPRLVCLGLGLAGAAAYVVMALIDVSYGQATALTDAGRAFQPITMAIISASGFLLVCGSGALYRARHFVLSAVLFAMTGAYMSYSALNGIGFFAGETIGKTRAAEAQNEANQKAVDRANDEAKAMRQQAMTWLTGTSIRAGKERERVEDKVIELATKPVEVKTAAPISSIGDPRAEVMKRLLGVRVEDAQIANSIWVVLLLVGAKLLGPSLMFALWPVKIDPKTETNGHPPDGTHESFKTGPHNTGKWQVLDGGKVSVTSKADARRDLIRMLQDAPSVKGASVLAHRWNWNLATVLRHLDAWEEEGLCQTEKQGRNRAVTRPKPKVIQSSA